MALHYRITTLGCRVNHAETRELESVLLSRGLAAADGRAAAADVEVVHTCTVTASAAAKSRQAIRRASRRPPPDGAPLRWGAADLGDRLARLEAPGFAATGGSGDHPVPRAIEMGANHHNGSVLLARTRLEVDPLDALPALLRMVYSFGGRPRHLWVDTAADVVLKSPGRDAVSRIEGAGIAALYFVDALPRNKQP